MQVGCGTGVSVDVQEVPAGLGDGDGLGRGEAVGGALGFGVDVAVGPGMGVSVGTGMGVSVGTGMGVSVGNAVGVPTGSVASKSGWAYAADVGQGRAVPPIVPVSVAPCACVVDGEASDDGGRACPALNPSRSAPELHVTIRHELQRIEGALQLMEYTKSRSSRRVIDLPEQTLEALREHRRRQVEERLQAGPLWTDNGFVFTTSNGTPLDGRNVLRYFQNALRRARLPHQRFHDTRHACASLLLAQGVPDHLVMNILGHSSIGVTKNLYAHVYPSMRKEAADKMNAALFGDREATS
jgi:hypothetical protein